MPVELGNVTLAHLTQVAVRERARIVSHAVPGMKGHLSQVLGRPSVEVSFQGIFYSEEADAVFDDLEQLRAVYLERQPIDFFTEAVGEGYFAQVLITRLDVWQRAGYPNQIDFACDVVEYVEPPEPVVADPLGALDADLIGEAIDFVDDVQNALEEVSDLVDLIANVPNFGDPTSRLPDMLDEFETLTGDGTLVLGTLTDLF